VALGLNLPNSITLLRILLVPVFITLLFVSPEKSSLERWFVVAIFVLAISTDGIDGAIARKRNLVTNLGKLLDPIADKALIGGALVALSILGELSWYITAVILIREVGITVYRLIVAKRRVIVASFSSHVHRVQQVVDAAIANNRKVALVGRSMVRNMQIAQQMGYLNVPDGVLIDSKHATDIPDNQLVYMSTGSQGEPMAVLARMANLEHDIEIGEGDTVILASSLIPGNENAVYKVIDGLTKLGANVVHKGNAKVHVSGHAAAGELLYCYNILKPKNVMPVHGEYRHLIANGKLAEQTGVPSERVLITEDGWVIDLADGIAEVVGAVECGLLFVDGKTVGKITEEDLKDRRVLAEEGFISIFCTIDAATGRIKIGPEIRARAFAEEDHVFDDVKPQIALALAQAAAEGIRDSYAMQQVIRRTIGTWVNKAHRRRPMIIPVVIVD
jgi:ribonuclease J